MEKHFCVIKRMSSAMKNNRNTNFEILRIISMLAIIAHHYVVNSKLLDINGPVFSNSMSWRAIFTLVFGAWGKTGINCFVLITGYFMCNKNITIRKYVKLLAQILFYSMIFYIIFLIFGREEVSLKRIVEVLFPITEIDKGFTSCYLMFFLFIPFLNVFVANLTESMHVCLLVLIATIYIFFPLLFINVTFNYITWFCVLYFIAAFVRKYPHKMFCNNKIWGPLAIFSLILAIVGIYICDVAYTIYGVPIDPYQFVAESNRICAFIVSFSFFIFFSNLKIEKNKLLNFPTSITVENA